MGDMTSPRYLIRSRPRNQLASRTDHGASAGLSLGAGGCPLRRRGTDARLLGISRQVPVRLEGGPLDPAFRQPITGDSPDRDPGEAHRATVRGQPEYPVVGASVGPSDHDAIARGVGERLEGLRARVAIQRLELPDPLLERGSAGDHRAARSDPVVLGHQFVDRVEVVRGPPHPTQETERQRDASFARGHGDTITGLPSMQ